jgi:glycosyltransferase involved in cell wall biosynthesis
MKIKKLSILIPVYNEAETIPVILEKIFEVKLTGSIKKV